MLPYSALMTADSAILSWVGTKNARGEVGWPQPHQHCPVGFCAATGAEYRARSNWRPMIDQPAARPTRPSILSDRLFDVETDRRIAEFKLARWDGHDGGRQKTTVKDLARLAADRSGRRAELYVLGDRPIGWLRSTTSSVRTKMKGYPAELLAFERAFHDPDIEISAFVAGPAAHVRLIDLEQRLPRLFKSVGELDAEGSVDP